MTETDVDDRKILTFDKRECISLKEAADIAGKSERHGGFFACWFGRSQL